ncbi:MAG TPA: DUF3047 domain-containing protein [Dissulfurispiraceae bacterium]|nr:DUF3047 domain-containing protein [Dissulfurispiraceae bacterium]
MYPLIIVFLLGGYVKACDAPALSVGFEGSLEKNSVPATWKLSIRTGTADASIVHESNMPVLHIRCRDASVSLERKLQVDPADYPYISWTWKAVRLPLSGDVRKKGHDDQVLQLLVAFQNRRVLSYIWDSNAPEGAVVDESLGWPINLVIKVIVVKSGPADSGKWITLKRNIYEDYRGFFNEPPPGVQGVRIQSNSQYTRDLAEGFVQDIVFSRWSQASAK